MTEMSKATEWDQKPLFQKKKSGEYDSSIWNKINTKISEKAVVIHFHTVPHPLPELHKIKLLEWKM